VLRHLGEEKVRGTGWRNNTDSFLDLAELLESLAESIIIGVPRKAASWKKDVALVIGIIFKSKVTIGSGFFFSRGQVSG
jgi:hypothetical protein